MEITITGMNAITHPHLDIWNWMVATYLFLGGVAAGLLIMSAVANLRNVGSEGKDHPSCVRAALLAPFVLMVGMFFIFLDLENKLHSFWFFLSFKPASPMSWGSWGLALIVPISMLYGLSVITEDHKSWLRFEFLKRLSDRLNPYVRPLAMINFGLGIFLGIYTGILLSVFVARPLWNSSLLPILFLASAASTGAALTVLIAGKKSAKLYFTKIDIGLIALEIVLILLFFAGHITSTEPHRESIMPFFSFTSEYFMFVAAWILLALLFPMALVLALLEVRESEGEELSSSALLRMKLSAVLVLTGAFIVRIALVYAGQLSKLT